MPLTGFFKTEKFEFPLRKTEVYCDTLDNSAEVSIKQTYFNHSNERVNSVYTFPIYSSATVVDFRIQFSTGTIVCKVEEARAAKEKYDEAISSGKRATLLTEKNAEEYDVHIGNIDPDETVIVHLRYLVHLEKDLDSDGLRFVLPTTITPRYDNSPQKTLKPDWDMPKVKNPPSLYNRVYDGDALGVAFTKPDEKENHEEERPNIVKEEKKQIVYSSVATESPVNITMNIVDTNGILDVLLPNWNGRVLERKVCEYDAYLSLQSLTLGEDFVLIILPKKSADSVKTVAWAEENSDGFSTVKVHLYEEDTYKIDNEKKYEFIMIIDRSGSMGGEQIINAKRALALLMNSLPVDSYFNIYGFGSNWKRFYKKSVKYSQETFTESKAIIENIRADLGGTEMNGVLEAVYAAPRIPQYERRIILLTDGEIFDFNSVYKIIDTDATVPIFTIGVGNSVSHELVKNLAERTGGTCEVVYDADLIEKKVLQQLKRTMYKANSVTLCGHSTPLLCGQEQILTRIETKELKDDSGHSKFLNIGLETDEDEHFISLRWKNVAVADDDGTDIENDKKRIDTTRNEPLKLSWVDKELRKLQKLHERCTDESEKEKVKTQIVELSTKEKVLTPFTAFVGVLESESETGKVAKETIVNPLHPTKKYVQDKDGYVSRMTGMRAVSGVSLCSPTGFGGAVLKGRGSAALKGGGRRGNSRNVGAEDEDDDEMGMEGGMFGGSIESTPERRTAMDKVSLRDSFDLVSPRLQRAIQFDGSVLMKELSSNISDIPAEVPSESCSADMWASMILMAYLTVHAGDAKETWKLTLEKCMNFVATNGMSLSEWKCLYDTAIEAVSF